MNETIIPSDFMSSPPESFSHSSEDQPLSLIEHLTELRRRLLYVLTAYGILSCLCYFYGAEILQWLAQPLIKALQGNPSHRFIYTHLAEGFLTYLKTALYAAGILTAPLGLNQIWRFIVPALRPQEERALRPFLWATPALFLIGALIAYYGVMPLACHFFVGFENVDTENVFPLHLEARLSEYVSLCLTFIFAFGLCFQLPIVLALLGWLGIIDASFLQKKRRYAIVLIFIVAAFLTPPDVVSQICLAIPLMILYEFSIILVKWTHHA